MKQLLLAHPTYNGRLNKNVQRSLDNQITKDIIITTKKYVRMPIHHARNAMLVDCLTGRYDYLLMCDDDNGPTDSKYAIQKLIDANVDIIGGYIRHRRNGGGLAVYNEKDLDYTSLPAVLPGVSQVGSIGTGFVLYSRDFVSHIYNTYGHPFGSGMMHFVKTSEGWQEINRALRYVCGKQPHELERKSVDMSEDLLFHWRARSLGYKIHAHGDVLLNHYDKNKIYSV